MEARLAQIAPSEQFERIIRTYIQACNNADPAAIAACFCPDAVHYFPHWPKWSGSATIGQNFVDSVRKLGHRWTVDQLIVDADRRAAVLEWTLFDGMGRTLRGVDLFVFEPTTVQIREMRPYYAVAPRWDDFACQELRDFDYTGRGYPEATKKA